MNAPIPAHYTHRLTVVFGDCDPAGIVYFPRFFHFFHTTMEMWFAEALVPYSTLFNLWRIGFPVVHAEADYRRPSAMGDRIDVELRVAGVGRSSLSLDFLVRGDDGDIRATGRTISAAMSLDAQAGISRRAVPIPEPLLSQLQAYLPAAPQQP